MAPVINSDPKFLPIDLLNTPALEGSLFATTSTNSAVNSTVNGVGQ